MDPRNFATVKELSGLAALLESVNEAARSARESGISLGTIYLFDSNGESLGSFGFLDGEYVFFSA